MGSFKIEQFGGMLPAWDPHLLPAGQGADSLNSYLFSGALLGWRVPKLLRALQNSAAQKVYRVPTVTQGVASVYLLLVTNVHAGDTLLVGEETYTFTATVTNPYDVLLGGTDIISADNLFKALTATGTNGVTYGTGTVANPAIDLVQSSRGSAVISSTTYQTVKLLATTFGSVYNTTLVSESTGHARLTWLFDLLSLADTTTTFQGGVNQTFDNLITGAATWMEFADRFTDVMRSPVVDDTFGRYYFASPSQQPKYNTYDRIVAGQAPWLLGIPAPGCNPGVTITSGGNFSTTGNESPDPAGSVNTPGANTLFVIKTTLRGAASLTGVNVVPEATSTTAAFRAVLYLDNAGLPGELVATGDEVIGCTAGTTLVGPFANPQGMLVDVTYWIGFICDSNISLAVSNNPLLTGVKAVATYSNGPSSFPSSVSGQPNWQISGNIDSSTVIEARAYVYTWVSAYGEEGPPSPPTLVNGWSNATWTIDMFTPPVDDMGVVRNITKLRLYRTVAGTAGDASFFFVTEQDVTLGTYVDIIPDSDIALNSLLPSALWFPPPEGLQAMLAMPNGMAVGFRGNELWFCEPYRPHAWPPSYVLTTDFPIVGLGVSGNSVVAATSGAPYTAAGVAPGQMVLTKASSAEPCNSRGSVLATNAGVYYVSPNGLVMVNPGTGQAENVTETWVTREKWQALVPQLNLAAIQLVSTYFAFQSGGQVGFMLELASDSASFTIWPQPGGHRIGFNRMASPLNVNLANIQTDPWTGIGLLIANGNVYYYDFSDQAPVIQPCTWRSKVLQQTEKKNFEAMKVYFTVPPNTPAQNAVRNTADTNDPSWNTLDTGQYGIVRVFADGVLVTTREIVRSGELLRVLSGFKAEEWQFEFTTRVLISNVQVASSAKELGNV